MALRGLLSSQFGFVLASWFALDASSPLRAAADGGDSSPPRNVLSILVEDLGETTDLSRQRAEKAAELRARLHAWLEQVGAHLPVRNR